MSVSLLRSCRVSVCLSFYSLLERLESAYLTEQEKKNVFCEFEGKVDGIIHGHCKCCRMVGITVTVEGRSRKCNKCKSGKRTPGYYLDNRLLPIWYDSENNPMYHVPEELSGLSVGEKLLIQLISPFIPVSHIKNGTMGIKGHVCSFPQNVNEVASVLPNLPDNVNVIRMVKATADEIGSDRGVNQHYLINRRRVLTALHWLKRYNILYSNITIDVENLGWMENNEELVLPTYVHETADIDGPNDGDINRDLGPSRQQLVEPRTSDNEIETAGIIADDQPLVTSPDDQIIIDLLRPVIAKETQIKVPWPRISPEPCNEHDKSQKIFCSAFPWLFPGGLGDVVDTKEDLRSWGRRMLMYEDGRFATDQLFCFFAMNYIIRHRNSSSGRFFCSDFDRTAPASLGELKEQIRSGDTRFVNNVTFYSKNVDGSDSYWSQQRSELYSWLHYHVERGNGAPSFFITLSCGESQWPEIERLVKERMRLAGLDASNVGVGQSGYTGFLNNYSIVIQEFFQERVQRWLDVVGRKVFGVSHHWVRYEFAPGRGQIHAHLLAICKDQLVLGKLLSMDKTKRVERLSTWAVRRFGLSASVGEYFDDFELDEKQSNSPCKVRFSSVRDDPVLLQKDLDHLKKTCQNHICSGFCMKGDKNKPNKRRSCKAGAGKEANAGKCDTPGFPLRDEPVIECDHRHVKRLYLHRNNSRVTQVSDDMLRSWRGNCDIQILVYESDPEHPSLDEIAQVTDYVVSYACKGNTTIQHQREQNKNLVLQ